MSIPTHTTRREADGRGEPPRISRSRGRGGRTWVGTIGNCCRARLCANGVSRGPVEYSSAPWRNAGAPHAVSLVAGCGRARGGRAGSRDSQRPMESRRQRRRVRVGVRVADRRKALPRHRQWHERAHHVVRRARHRSRRRGRRSTLYVRGDDQRRLVDARAAGVR